MCERQRHHDEPREKGTKNIVGIEDTDENDWASENMLLLFHSTRWAIFRVVYLLVSNLCTFHFEQIFILGLCVSCFRFWCAHKEHSVANVRQKMPHEQRANRRGSKLCFTQLERIARVSLMKNCHFSDICWYFRFHANYSSDFEGALFSLGCHCSR